MQPTIPTALWVTRNLWHNITHVVPTWEMFREFMADELNILGYYHQLQLVILRQPLVNYEECSIWLTTENMRCNECLMGKNRYTGVCWFVSTDSVGRATLMNQLLPMPQTKRYLPGALLLWFFLIGVCSNIWWLLLQINAICWHGKALWNVVLGVHNQLFFVKPFIHLNKIFQYTLPWWEWYYRNSISVSKVYLTYCGHNGVLKAKLYALTAYSKPTGIDDITYEV